MREILVRRLIDYVRRHRKVTAFLKKSSTIQKLRNNSVTAQKFKFWCKGGRRIVVPINKILCGGESNTPASKFAKLIGDLMRPSTPFSKSPHVKLLEQYLEIREALFNPEKFRQTEYRQKSLTNKELDSLLRRHAKSLVDDVIRNKVIPERV